MNELCPNLLRKLHKLHWKSLASICHSDVCIMIIDKHDNKINNDLHTTCIFL